MNTNRKARWAVRQSALPTVVRPCPDCSSTRHRASGKIRVNANGKLLDVWLLLSCAACDRTSKVPVHERVHVSSLDPARRVAYETNSPAVVRELTMSAALAAKNGYRLDWTGTWELETRTPLYALDDPTPLRVLVSFELPAPVRVERLLMLGLGLSRTETRRMVGDGRIQVPLALDAKAHQDFELTIHGPGSVDAAKHSKLLGAPADVRTDVHTELSHIGWPDNPQQLSRSATAGA
ncbi:MULTISPECIES: DUF1062 domain-containing protein [unclassified Kitasatospora]|uniref:DUF1062 domain-containing protein n=1 Tax=unclassified Kitasatospora TaxID=2633591 RepID=UPI00070BE401|nr:MULTISPECIES: DUF1062 domain-containing protein [unclassified Kitasatospora]KQV17539.1 hypothetical protein ASC99_25565 [Kitasatospora sp. Root107]KRB69214.1 hypothetical protein ASE03_27610 [Kitasatospora sp. Root187]